MQADDPKTIAERLADAPQLARELATLLEEERAALNSTTVHDHSGYNRAYCKRMNWLKANSSQILAILQEASGRGVAP